MGENQQEYVATFSYDSQNRPIALNYGDFGGSTTTLDALGQLIRVNDRSEPLLTTRFTYGNANWKDQLTEVDGVAITYDAIGNPLNDGTWTYIWQNGRQLAGMRKSGMEVSFRYNANGLRTHKIVNGVVTRYTLHGKNVVHMTKGEDDLHFFYDALSTMESYNSEIV